MLFLWTRSWPNCGRCYFLSLRTEKCTVCMLFSVLLGGAWCCLVLWKMRKLTLTRTPDPVRLTSLVLTLTRTSDPIRLTSLVLTLTDPFTPVLCTLPHIMEADVATAGVQFDCAKSSPLRSTGSATPLEWSTVDLYNASSRTHL